MRDLERELQALAVEWPPTPDIAGAVTARLREEPEHRWQSRAGTGRRGPFARLLRPHPALAWALAALAVAAGVLAASPDARSAILELLGLEGATIERREPVVRPRPTPAPLGRDLDLGTASTPERAVQELDFAVRVPEPLGRPDATYVTDRVPGGQVSFVYARVPGVAVSRHSGVAVLVTVAEATVTPIVGKAAGRDTRIEELRVDGQRGYRLTGGAHGFAFITRDREAQFEERLAGTTVLLERDGRLVRVEGELPAERAIAIARAAAP